MRVVIAGGHGQIALLLERRLAARDDTAIGIIRNPAQVADVEAAGAEALVRDLETTTAADLAAGLIGADAVVFAAGAGPNSGAPRKDTVDRAAAILLADAAAIAGVRRYLLVSSIGAGAPPPDGTEPGFVAYLEAKTAAEVALTARDDLDLTILRPGRLTDDPAAATVTLAPSVERGAISRDDVAAVLIALLDAPHTSGKTLELVGGDTPIPTAVAQA
jgi:uncharacterized protein YbjT (DUF2867 family)